MNLFEEVLVESVNILSTREQYYCPQSWNCVPKINIGFNWWNNSFIKVKFQVIYPLLCTSRLHWKSALQLCSFMISANLLIFLAYISLWTATWHLLVAGRIDICLTFVLILILICCWEVLLIFCEKSTVLFFQCDLSAACTRE